MVRQGPSLTNIRPSCTTLRTGLPKATFLYRTKREIMGLWDWFKFNFSHTAKITHVHIVYNKRQHVIHFEPNDYEHNCISLSTLRRCISDAVHVSENELYVYQTTPTKRRLSGDATSIASLGIKSGDQLVVVSPRQHRAQPRQPDPPAPKLSPEEQIQAAVDKIENDLKPRIDAFIASPPTDKEKREDEHRVLTEIILQSILKMDAVDVENNPELRSLRKKSINLLHKYHEELDGANSARACDAAASQSDLQQDPQRNPEAKREVENESRVAGKAKVEAPMPETLCVPMGSLPNKAEKEDELAHLETVSQPVQGLSQEGIQEDSGGGEWIQTKPRRHRRR